MKRTLDPHIEAALRARKERDDALGRLMTVTVENNELRARAPSRALSSFTTDELFAEIVRRRRIETAGRRPETFCETCMHFVPKPDASGDYNPCSKKHAMDFWMEADPVGPDVDCGFHRVACEDRA